MDHYPSGGQHHHMSRSSQQIGFSGNRNSKRGTKTSRSSGRSEIEIMFESRRGVKVKNPDKDARRKRRRSSADSKPTRKPSSRKDREPDVMLPFPLLTLPRVELTCRAPNCNRVPGTAMMSGSRGSSSSSAQSAILDSRLYGRTVPGRYPSFHRESESSHRHGRAPKNNSNSSNSDPRITTESSGTETSVTSSKFLVPLTYGSGRAHRSRSQDKVAGNGSYRESVSSSRSARAARAAAEALEFQVNGLFPPKPSELSYPGSAVRCSGSYERTKPVRKQDSTASRGSTSRRDPEKGQDPTKSDPYNTFWHLSNYGNFQPGLKREASVRSFGGFTLNGHPGRSKVKKSGWTRFCSSHKIAFVVSTFSVLVTLGLVITLLLMKKKGMMEGMK